MIISIYATWVHPIRQEPSTHNANQTCSKDSRTSRTGTDIPLVSCFSLPFRVLESGGEAASTKGCVDVLTAMFPYASGTIRSRDIRRLCTELGVGWQHAFSLPFGYVIGREGIAIMVVHNEALRFRVFAAADMV